MILPEFAVFRHHGAQWEQQGGATRIPLRPPVVSLFELLTILSALRLLGAPPVRKGIALAVHAHALQRRDDGSPYLEQHIYPVTVACIQHELLSGRDVRPNLVAAALTHDVPEDDPEMPLQRFESEMARAALGHEGGPHSVYGLVDPLTKRDPSIFPGPTARERRIARDEAYYRQLEDAGYESLLIKAADRENNIFCSHNSRPAKLRSYLIETERHFLDITREVSPAVMYPRLMERLDQLWKLL